ncbi:MAG: magnesium transporter [Myxococcales bacterium]|nr:magnesium transporter [Myxococcales bacterium]
MHVASAIVPKVRELLRVEPDGLQAFLDEIHNEDIADLLGLLSDEEAMQLLERIGADAAADIFERLEDHEREHLVERFGAVRLAPIVSEMDPDEATDLIEGLPDVIGDELLGRMAPDAAAEVRPLLEWPEDTAGGLMTTQLVSASPDTSAAELIELIRARSDEVEMISYVYAVDGGRMVGVASLRDVIVSQGQTRLREFMSTDVRSVLPGTDQEEVARVLSKYDVTALPVVDEEHRLLGVITVDDVIDVIAKEQTEDIQRLAGVGPIDDRYFDATFWTFLAKRAPWLAVLFVGEFFAGQAMRNFDYVLASVSSLAFYVPLLISTGGNTGSQSASLIIRGLATGEIAVGDWRAVLRRELSQGLALGVLLASLGMARVWLWGDPLAMVATVGVTLICIVLLGCTIGAMFPLILRKVGLDPATSSTPFIATVIDVVGILIYFSIAKVFLASLISKSAHP